MRIYPAHATDFYKTGHIRQYPPETSFVYSNLTCRSDRLARLLPDFDHKVVSFGIQGVCKWLLRDAWNREFFHRPKAEVVDRYKRRMDSSLGSGAVDVSHIAALHDLGYLPILVKALPEGSRVNIRVPLFTIQNTIPEFYWLSNYHFYCRWQQNSYMGGPPVPKQFFLSSSSPPPAWEPGHDTHQSP